MAIKINIECNKDYAGDFNELLRAFSPYLIEGGENTATIEIINREISNCTIITLKYNGALEEQSSFYNYSELLKQKSAEKRAAKILLYQLFSRLSGFQLPYGSLTGIRPTKLYRETESDGTDAYKYFVDTLKVAPKNADFIRRTVENQRAVFLEDSDTVNLFVNIPICVTRCCYCSFISAEYGKIKKLIAPYVAQLVREIAACRKIIGDNNYKLRAIYVGGGTPTSLNNEEFAAVIGALKGLEPQEFTVEAGRPDTITAEKLDIMADAGVTRISVNPQSFNDKTLEIIGRSHSAREVEECYCLAREYPFLINMDLIAMLPGESLDDFKFSVDKCISLAPDNITVHTLALKKGSALKLGEYSHASGETAAQMINYSRSALQDADYYPYYMYRQKYMSGNLENTGFSKTHAECLYNVDIMEESLGIVAAGAGGISKRIFIEEGRLERLAAPKGIDVYLEREDKIIADKVKFFAR